jgi:hypothetical protein
MDMIHARIVIPVIVMRVDVGAIEPKNGFEWVVESDRAGERDGPRRSVRDWALMACGFQRA